MGNTLLPILHQPLKQRGHKHTKVVTQGITHDASAEADNKRLTVFEHGNHHGHEGWRVDKRHRRHGHRIGINTHNTAEDGVQHQRAKDGNDEVEYLIEAFRKIKFREICHRGHGDAEDIDKVHTNIEATLQLAHGHNKREHYTQCADNEDEDHHKPIIATGQRNACRDSHCSERKAHNLRQLHKSRFAPQALVGVTLCLGNLAVELQIAEVILLLGARNTVLMWFLIYTKRLATIVI